MKLAAISDTHGNKNILKQFCEKFKTTDVIIHLGDGYSDYCHVKNDYPNLVFVTGNNDFSSDQPLLRFFELEGVKILAVHGNGYGVKRNLERLKNLAKKKGADIVLFGHTHVSHISFEEGIYLCNPGAACYGGFAEAFAVYIEKIDDKIKCCLVEID